MLASPATLAADDAGPSHDSRAQGLRGGLTCIRGLVGRILEDRIRMRVCLGSLMLCGVVRRVLCALVHRYMHVVGDVAVRGGAGFGIPFAEYGVWFL